MRVMNYEKGGRLVHRDGTEYEITAVRRDGTLELRRLAGSGLVTSMRQFYLPGGPSDQPVPTSQTAAPPVKVKVLSMWPLRQVSRETLDWWSADKADLILPQYRFGEAELGRMHGQILREMIAWEEVWRPYITAALQDSDPERAKTVSANIYAHLEAMNAYLAPTVESLLLAANAGLSASSKAFNEVTAELRAWPAAAVPAEVVNACIAYTQDWSLTTEAAAERFKEAAKVWADVYRRIVALTADYRQLKEKEIAILQEGLEEARREVARLQQRVAELERGGSTLDTIRENFEGVLKAGKDAVNKALNAVGSALPAVAGGLGMGLVLLIGLAAAAFALKR